VCARHDLVVCHGDASLSNFALESGAACYLRRYAESVPQAVIEDTKIECYRLLDEFN
jgi:aminoglycoside phosphotransferase